MTTLATEFYTADRVIRMAAQDAKIVASGQELSSERYKELMNRLQDIVNHEQTRGLKLFLYQDTAVTLTAAKATYSFGPSGADVTMTKPLAVVDGYFLDSSGNSIPIFPISWQEYIQLGDKSASGSITQYLEDKQTSLFKVTFYHVPDTSAATGTVQLLFRLQAPNPLLLNDAVGFPPEWYMFLRWQLASDSAGDAPVEVQNRCLGFAEKYKEDLEGWDVEDASTRFSPDMDRGMGRRNFS